MKPPMIIVSSDIGVSEKHKDFTGYETMLLPFFIGPDMGPISTFSISFITAVHSSEYGIGSIITGQYCSIFLNS
jgi:hypothetical protein